MKKKLITMKQAARMLGTTTVAIQGRLIRETLPRSLTFKIGKRVYFDHQELLAWIEANRRSDSE